MNDDVPNPYTPKHSIEAQRGYPTQKRKWDRPVPLCSNCGSRKVYQPDIETMDWCEHCLWEYVKEDQVLGSNNVASDGEQELTAAITVQETPEVLGWRYKPSDSLP